MEPGAKNEPRRPKASDFLPPHGTNFHTDDGPLRNPGLLGTVALLLNLVAWGVSIYKNVARWDVMQRLTKRRKS